MSYLNLPNKEDLGEREQEMFQVSIDKWGYVPNLVRAYALAPKIMAAEEQWTQGVMLTGFLPRVFKEAIATVVSATNDCQYCASSHSHAHTLSGGKMEDSASCKMLDFSSFVKKERLVLEFTRKATANPKAITQDDINDLRVHYSDSEIVEITTVIQQYMGYNWFVTILGLELEAENPMADIQLGSLSH
jgi:uncharacterized peroxidase-related enzyme